eukprot:363648-Chlamydomonas_euryale.AAC.1
MPAWLRSCMATWLHGCMAAWPRIVCMLAWLHGYMATQLHHLGNVILGGTWPGTWVAACRNGRMLGKRRHAWQACMAALHWHARQRRRVHTQGMSTQAA